MKQIAIAFICFVAGISSACAANNARFPAEDWSSVLLQRIEQGPFILPRDFDTHTAKPADDDSAETRADLDELLHLQDTARTQDQLALIARENEQGKNHPVQIFMENGLIDARKNSSTIDLLKDVVADVDFFVLREKRKFERVRPTQLEPRLTTVIDIPPHASYPSGHAGQNYAVALVLSYLDPAQRESYLKLAVDVAHRREIAGVHFASDSDAGRDLARNVVEALMHDDALRPKINAAQKEFSSAAALQ